MRIREINIIEWRHFQNLTLSLDENVTLVCIVGANGAGKSQILELIASCAHRLGLAQGVDLPRGDPFNDIHSFSLRFSIAPGVSAAVDEGLREHAAFGDWDRTITITSRRSEHQTSTRIEAGGNAPEGDRLQLAEAIVGSLRRSSDVHFLSLDADRAYPKKTIQIHEVAQAYETDWEGLEFTRGRSFRPTTTLYDEWIKYFLGQENQSGTRLMAEFRRATEYGVSDGGDML